MIESNHEDGPRSSEEIAYDLEWDRLDRQGILSNAQIKERLGEFPVVNKPQQSPIIPPVSSHEGPLVNLSEVKTTDLTGYSQDDLAAALEALSSGEIDDFDGFNQAEIAREVDRRYEEALVSGSLKSHTLGEDVVVSESGQPKTIVDEIHEEAAKARSGSTLDDPRFAGTSIRPVVPPAPKKKYPPRRRPYYGPRG